MCKKRNRDADENWEGNPVNTEFTRVYFLFLIQKQSTCTELTEHTKKNWPAVLNFKSVLFP